MFARSSGGRAVGAQVSEQIRAYDKLADPPSACTAAVPAIATARSTAMTAPYQRLP